MSSITVVCPECGEPVEGYLQLAGDGSVPQPGNLAVCSDCGAISEFANLTGTLVLADLTPEQQEEEMAANPALRRAVRAIVERDIRWA